MTDQEWVAALMALLPMDIRDTARDTLERYLDATPARKPAAALIMAFGLLAQAMDETDGSRPRRAPPEAGERKANEAQ
jgi:hypothetical protein